MSQILHFCGGGDYDISCSLPPGGNEMLQPHFCRALMLSIILETPPGGHFTFCQPQGFAAVSWKSLACWTYKLLIFRVSNTAILFVCNLRCLDLRPRTLMHNICCWLWWQFSEIVTRPLYRCAEVNTEQTLTHQSIECYSRADGDELLFTSCQQAPASRWENEFRLLREPAL